MADTTTPTVVTQAPVKSGFLSSEFILNAVKMIVGALLSTGVVAPNSTVGQVIGAVLVMSSAVAYTWLRTNLKKAAIDAGLAALNAIEADVTAGTAAAATPSATPSATAAAPASK